MVAHPDEDKEDDVPNNREQPVLNESGTESSQETTFRQDQWEEEWKEFNLDNSKAFPSNEVQNCEVGFIHTTDDCDPCSASNLIELDIDPS